MKLFVAPSWRIPISWSDPWGLAAASANTAETIEHGSDVEHVVDSLWLQICSACGRGQVVDCCRRERRHVAGQVENWNHWYASATSALWGLEHQVGRGQAGEVGGGGSNVDNGGLDGDHGSAHSSVSPLPEANIEKESQKFSLCLDYLGELQPLWGQTQTHHTTITYTQTHTHIEKGNAYISNMYKSVESLTLFFTLIGWCEWQKEKYTKRQNKIPIVKFSLQFDCLGKQC